MDEKHREFVKLYLEGHSGAEAYAKVFGVDGVAAYNGAYRLMRNPNVRAELQRLREEIDKKWLLSRDEKRAVLGEIIGTREFHKTADVLKAIEADNRMAGHDAPAVVQVTGIEELIHVVRTQQQ